MHAPSNAPLLQAAVMTKMRFSALRQFSHVRLLLVEAREGWYLRQERAQPGVALYSDIAGRFLSYFSIDLLRNDNSQIAKAAQKQAQLQVLMGSRYTVYNRRV
jgi:hypothetical protein